MAKSKSLPSRRLEVTFVARDPRMVEVVKLVERLASAPSNVLLSGESGTGKDLVAQALHFWGPRASLPIVKVDLPSIAAALIESELFGHERGAFTGATATKLGRLEMAKHGTLFLDQLGELSPVLQAKLLRVVEDRRFERLGGTEVIELHARVVAAASADLERAVELEHFRRDLFHRLGVFWLRLPPLRERPDDIIPLAKWFLSREVERLGKSPSKFTDEVLDVMMSYGWPGNVRELKGVVEHGALMSRGETIARADLPTSMVENSSVTWGSSSGHRPSLDDVERNYIEFVLNAVGGNKSRAAEILGISRKSLWERRQRYDLN